MNPASPKATLVRAHRIDLACEQAGFSTPPFDVHIKFLPSPAADSCWALLAHGAPGKADALARWLGVQPGVQDIRVAPGLAPKLLRATVVALPPTWAKVASLAKVHHLDLTAEGHASWFLDGGRDEIFAVIQLLTGSAEPPLAAREVRARLVQSGSHPLVTPRQSAALAAAVALGYYEIPHRIDLRALAKHTGVSLGSVSELLRRAEAAILTHYVDSNLMLWPVSNEGTGLPSPAMVNLLRPVTIGNERHSVPRSE